MVVIVDNINNISDSKGGKIIEVRATVVVKVVEQIEVVVIIVVGEVVVVFTAVAAVRVIAVNHLHKVLLLILLSYVLVRVDLFTGLNAA